MILPVSKIFDCISGNSEITENNIYNSVISDIDKYTVLSSALDEDTQMGMISLSEIDTEKGIFEDNIGILVSRNGKAGQMSFIEKGKYIINDHAYILTIKEDAYDVLRLGKVDFIKWFIIKHQPLVNQYSTKNDNATWNKTSFFKFAQIEIPTKSEIKSYCKIFDKLQKFKNGISSQIKLIDNVLIKKLTYESKSIEHIKINQILDYISRNDILSEEGLYNYDRTKSKKSIKVLSGSIDNIYYGEISDTDNDIHTLKNSQCLHIVTRGKSGRLTYLPKGNYATNTNAFLIYLIHVSKNDLGIKNEIDEEYYLKFLKIYLEPTFIEISSKSDVGVFPLTNVFDNMELPKFVLNNEIKSVVDKYYKILEIKKMLEIQLSKVYQLEEKEILN